MAEQDKETLPDNQETGKTDPASMPPPLSQETQANLPSELTTGSVPSSEAVQKLLNMPPDMLSELIKQRSMETDPTFLLRADPPDTLDNDDEGDEALPDTQAY